MDSRVRGNDNEKFGNDNEKFGNDNEKFGNDNEKRGSGRCLNEVVAEFFDSAGGDADTDEFEDAGSDSSEVIDPPLIRYMPNCKDESGQEHRTGKKDERPLKQ